MYKNVQISILKVGGNEGSSQYFNDTFCYETFINGK